MKKNQKRKTAQAMTRMSFDSSFRRVVRGVCFAAGATILTAVLPLFSVAQDTPNEKPNAKQTVPLRALSNPPLSFEENREADNKNVEFLARGRGHVLSLTKEGASLKVVGKTNAKTNSGHTGKIGSSSGDTVLQMKFAGSDAQARIQGESALPGKVYYADPHSRGMLASNSTFEHVKYFGIYPGVDAIYYGNESQLEFDFLVAPHADPRQICLAFTGVNKMKLTPAGEVSLDLHGHDVRLRKPTIYQEQNGARKEISGKYVWRGRRQVGFELAAYDANLPLIIDPSIVFATYIGGTGDDSPVQMRVNSVGEIYVTANSTVVSSIPATKTFPIETPQAGFRECFLTKLSADGATALYTVVFGGVQCEALEIEPGKVHLSMGKSGNYLRTLREDAFGQPLSLDLLQGAYDFINGPAEWMRVDSTGDLYLVINDTPDGTSDLGYELQKVDPNGNLINRIRLITTPVVNNFISDQITAMDIDQVGNAYIVGIVKTPGIITPTANAFQSVRPSPGDFDGFLLRVNTSNPNNFVMDYASYLGGAGDDRPFAVAFDPYTSDVFIGGGTTSIDFPTTIASTVKDRAGFLTKLNLSQAPASQLQAGLLVNGSFSNVSALTVLAGGVPAIAGSVADSQGPGFGFALINSLYPARLDGNSRPFLRVYSPDETQLTFSSYLDNVPNSNFITSLATNGSQSVYLSSSTSDGTLGTAGSFHPTNQGDFDGLVEALDISSLVPANSPPQVSFSPSSVSVNANSPTSPVLFPLTCGQLFQCNVTDPDGDAITEFTWRGPNGFQASLADSVPSATVPLTIGSYNFQLIARDARGALGSGTLQVFVSGINTGTSPVEQTIILTDNLFTAASEQYKGNPHPARITFQSVETAGLTWLVSRSNLLPAPPDGLQAGSPPYYYDIHSTAQFTGPAYICLSQLGMSFANPNGVQVYELQSGTWTLLQTTIGTESLCAFSTLPTVTGTERMTTLALFYPQVPATTVTTIAGTGFAENSIDGQGGDPRDDESNALPPAQSALTHPGSLALDFPRRVLYISEAGTSTAIQSVNLSHNTSFSLIPTGNALPSGPLALDSTGSFLYFVRASQAPGAQEVVKHDLTSGVDVVVAGGGGPCCDLPISGQPANIGALSDVSSLAVDALGNLFLTNGTSVYKVDGNDTWSWVLNESGTQIANVFSIPVADTPRALAFDQEGFLLVGGQIIVRLSPGTDGVTVDGSPVTTYSIVAGTAAANMAGYAQPFGGDGSPAQQAAIAVNYQMIVAQDGAIILADGVTHRIRRIAPGSDGIVDGNSDAGETIQTIAGFYSAIQDPVTKFATSYFGDYRGIAQDTINGNFYLSTFSGNTVQSTGISPFSGGGNINSADLSITATVNPDPATIGNVLTYGPITVTNNGPAPATGVILNFTLPATANFDSAATDQGSCNSPAVGSTGTVTCALDSIAPAASVHVTIGVKPQTADTLAATISVLGNEPDPTPANNIANLSTTVTQGPALINITETITVTDTPSVLPSAMIPVTEIITVTDTPNILPSAMIPVNEVITVVDVPNVTPQNMPPVVTPPAGITIAATETDGARGNVSAALHSFLLAGTATDDKDSNPQRLTPQADLGAGLVDVNDLTIFPVRTISVTFAFRDADGAVGKATANVTVTPPVGGVVSVGGFSIVTPTNAFNIGQPVELDFAAVTQQGLATAIPVTPTPAAPSGMRFIGTVYEISTTAAVTPPITVCFLGTGFTPADQIWHAGQLIGTVLNTPTRICAQTNTLSPFGVVRSSNTPPTADAGPDQTVEATSVAGASVGLKGNGTDAEGDPLTYAWSSATCTSGAGQVVTVQCALGSNTVTLTVSDGRGGTTKDSAVVTVRDTTPPTLVLPTNITAEATSAAGAVVTFSASASDAVSGALAPLCVPASGNVFPLGTTTVTCTARDASSNAASGSFKVLVRDTTAPAISLNPSQITVVVGSVPATRAALGLPVPVVHDSVDSHPRVTDNAPASFSTGTYTIVFTATDASGNSAKATLTVNVQLRLNILNAAVVVTQFKAPHTDLLAAELTVQLGSGNDGIKPAVDSFHFLLNAGPATLTIDLPLSKFQQFRDGSLLFSGNSNGVPTDLAIKPLGGSKYAIVVGVAKANLSGFTNPASIGLNLGNDTGQVATKALILKK